MRPFDYVILEQQAKTLEILRSKAANIETFIAAKSKELERILPKGEFYRDMQQKILTNPELMDAWRSFMVMVQFTLENPVEGITHPTKRTVFADIADMVAWRTSLGMGKL